MKYIICVFLLLSFSANATKGLLEINVLEAPNGKGTPEVANPKINAGGITDLNVTDRTNQAMTLQSLNATQAVFDQSSPYDNTLETEYDPKKIIKLRVREFMGTFILLPQGDAIEQYNVMDTNNFAFNVAKGSKPNSGIAIATLAGADTALHIKGTSGNHYTFYLRGDTWDSPHPPTMKVIIKDSNLITRLEAKKRRVEAAKAKEKKEKMELAVNDRELENPDYLEKVDVDPSKYDFEYRIKGGDESLRPYIVYSDGHFTYFRFSESESVAEVTEFPVIFRVADGSDEPTNYTAKGSTIAVEGIANNWTLRLGDRYLCIEKKNKIQMSNSAMNKVLGE